jgi:hypothetical protein
MMISVIEEMEINMDENLNTDGKNFTWNIQREVRRTG